MVLSIRPHFSQGMSDVGYRRRVAMCRDNRDAPPSAEDRFAGRGHCAATCSVLVVWAVSLFRSLLSLRW